MPGDTVTYTLTIRDQAGNPVPNVETSVALVDKAVLVLGAGYQNTQSLVDIFYYERPLGVTTGSLIVINKDRSQRPTGRRRQGWRRRRRRRRTGGARGVPRHGLLARRPRQRRTGVIEFAVKLPDNLTTWVLTAKGVTKDTLVGEATNEIVATKELQVRPALPRFFTAGDRAIIGGVVLNSQQDALDGGEFTIAVSGATLEGDPGAQPFSLDAGAFTTFDFPITVDPTAATVVVTMTAVAGDLSDGVRMTMPVVRYQSPETVGTSGEVPRGRRDRGHLRALRTPPTTAN